MINVPKVRVIDENGENLGVLYTREAIEQAADVGLDLVEVSPNADPPVCKFLDVGKFRYEAQKKANLARKSQKTQEIKEIKMRPNIDDHDYDVKLRNVHRFLEDGDKVKVTLRFRGRELSHQQLGMNLLKRVQEDVVEIAKVEAFPRMEGRQMLMVLAPSKASRTARLRSNCKAAGNRCNALQKGRIPVGCALFRGARTLATPPGKPCWTAAAQGAKRAPDNDHGQARHRQIRRETSRTANRKARIRACWRIGLLARRQQRAGVALAAAGGHAALCRGGLCGFHDRVCPRRLAAGRCGLHGAAHDLFGRLWRSPPDRLDVPAAVDHDDDRAGLHGDDRAHRRARTGLHPVPVSPSSGARAHA
jgi:translation initiation factor IF-3